MLNSNFSHYLDLKNKRDKITLWKKWIDLPSGGVVHLHPVVAVDPEGEASKNDVSHERAEDAKDHDVLKVLEEPLTAHVVARSEYNRRDAEIEQNVVVEDDVLLNHVIAAHEGAQTDEEAE